MIFRRVKLKALSGETPHLYTGHDYLPELIQSIKQIGLMNPILVRLKVNNGPYPWLEPERFEIICGFLRVKAARYLGWKTIPARIIELTDAQLIEANIIASTPYVKTTPEQYRSSLQRVLEVNPELTRDELASRINWSREKLDKFLEI